MDRRRFLAGAIGGIAATAATWRSAAAAEIDAPVPAGFTRLLVSEGELTANGITGRAYRIEGTDGALGWRGAAGDRFRVAVDNTTADPLTLHWHGIILPNGQDGVPYVTQAPIKPGSRRLYDFPLIQTGTYWMHSHWGLQEQWMMTAPLIIRAPRSSEDAADVVMMLNDFTARDPAAILADLRKSAASSPMADTKTGGAGAMAGMKMGGGAAKAGTGGADLNDVRYDALLANRRGLSDPDVIRVEPGRPLRLRVLNMCSGTNVFVSAGRLGATLVAVDGEEIVPMAGSLFELGVAQRMDLLVSVPAGDGAYPILALGEGADLQAGIVLATPGATLPALVPRAERPAPPLTNKQEGRLRAAKPLAARAVNRRLRVVLGGDMATYTWSLNGQAWPKITPLVLKKGERVEIAFANQTGMTHPMHLHGHVFQVTEVDGVRVRGARRDTVLVTPGRTVKVEFDAVYPGYWMIHCHLLYHQAAGMMTVMRYEGFSNQSYDPLASLAEFPSR